MTKITTGASVSLDGFIAGPAESGFEHLFQWYGNGDVAFETTSSNIAINVTEASAEIMREIVETTGCFVVGRHLFDITNGWGGKHTLGIPYVVLTHSVPDGWALAAGLLDEIDVDLVPVILGGGRPFFRPLQDGPFLLEGPIKSVQGDRVTHLRYRVVKA